MIVSIFFLDNLAGLGSVHGPALQSRTRDGLNVKLEISFQYKLKQDTLYDMYTTLGETYEKTFIRMAVEQLTTAATLHDAHYFFVNRTHISKQMHTRLSKHFEEVGFAEIPFFQLRTVHLPSKFEEAIKETQVKQQEIKIAKYKQETMTVTFETRVLEAQQYVKQLQNQAEAQAAVIQLNNDAFCEQYTFAQNVQAEALALLKKEASWSPDQLLDYLRVRAAQLHPSNRTMIRF
jgi:regulator of protease activity HflC (stomatin/prohibitin superfamily)